MIRLTDEDKLLGRSGTKIPTLSPKNLFSKEQKYLVHYEGLHNDSVVDGCLVASILPCDLKSKIMHGATVVNYGGIIIEKFQEEPPKAPETEETQEYTEPQKPTTKTAPKKKAKPKRKVG